MKFQLEQDHLGNLVARQHAGKILRYVIGVPLLLWGALMLYGTFSSFIIQMQDKGMGGLPEALLGSFVLLIFTALVLPLGWWLVFSRHRKVIEEGTREIVEISDWIVGRKEKRTPAKAFRAVRVGLEPLDSSSSGGDHSHVTYCQQIRLLARAPESQPSIEIGSHDEKAREQAIRDAQRVADFLKLELEIADADAVLSSPAREAAEKEALDEGDA
jgi:hypothetical protein